MLIFNGISSLVYRVCSKMSGYPPAGHNEFCTAVGAKQLAFGKCDLLRLCGQSDAVEALRKNVGNQKGSKDALYGRGHQPNCGISIIAADGPATAAIKIARTKKIPSAKCRGC